MENIKISNITQKAIRSCAKKGSVEIKFRSSFKHPLTGKRRDFLSNWYISKNHVDDFGKVLISNQLKSIIQIDMQNLANKLYQEISKSSLISNKDVTFEQVWTEWQEDRIIKKKVAPKTLAGEKGRYKNHFLKYIPADSLIKNLRSDLIQSMIDDYYPIGNHKRIAQALRSDLSSLFVFATKKNYITPEQNPISFVKVDNKGLKEKIDELKAENIGDFFLEKDELKEVLNIVQHHNQQYARIFEFQVLTGMRIGEVLGLKVIDFDFENRTVSIVRSRATHSGAFMVNYEGNVKNAQSYRTISISDRAIELVKEEIAENELHIITNDDYIDNGWIFTSKSKNKAEFNGTPIHYGVLNSFLNSTENGKVSKTTGKIKKVGIAIDTKLSFNKHISTHIFRHTHISFLASEGIPLEAIQERVGHTRGSRVTSIYLHVTKSMKKEISKVIDSLTTPNQ